MAGFVDRVHMLSVTLKETFSCVELIFALQSPLEAMITSTKIMFNLTYFILVTLRNFFMPISYLHISYFVNYFVPPYCPLL